MFKAYGKSVGGGILGEKQRGVVVTARVTRGVDVAQHLESARTAEVADLRGVAGVALGGAAVVEVDRGGATLRRLRVRAGVAGRVGNRRRDRGRRAHRDGGEDVWGGLRSGRGQQLQEEAFDGAFCVRLLAGDDPFTAAHYANTAAALATTGFGAVAPLPDDAAVRALLGTVQLT